MLKKILLLALMATAVFASDKQQTLLSGDLAYGGFGGPIWQVSSFNGEIGVIDGGRGSFLVNHSLAFGFSGYDIINNVNMGHSINDKEMLLKMSYGGFHAEYIKNWENLVHYTAGLMLGGGYARLEEENPVNRIDSSYFMVVEPSVSVELNVYTWVRFGGMVSYRLVQGLEMSELTNMDLSSPSVGLYLKFGWF